MQFVYTIILACKGMVTKAEKQAHHSANVPRNSQCCRGARFGPDDGFGNRQPLIRCSTARRYGHPSLEPTNVERVSELSDRLLEFSFENPLVDPPLETANVRVLLPEGTTRQTRRIRRFTCSTVVGTRLRPGRTRTLAPAR